LVEDYFALLFSFFTITSSIEALAPGASTNSVTFSSGILSEFPSEVITSYVPL
jgi:hypothetical protein